MDELLEAVRGSVTERAWGVAVKAAREDRVLLVSREPDEIKVQVKLQGKSPNEVFLWPDDPDWGCDCGLPGKACVHVAAAAIAMKKGGARESAEPALKETTLHKVAVRYDFKSEKSALTLSRMLVWTDGRVEKLTESLEGGRLVVNRADSSADKFLRMRPPGPLAPDTLRGLLRFLEGTASATLDDEPVLLAQEDLFFEIRVIDEAEGFKLGLFRPEGITKLFRGAALRDGVLRPTSHGGLSRDQRRELIRGVHYAKDEVGKLMDTLPGLREKGVPVKVLTSRLPSGAQLMPQVEIGLKSTVEGLEVTPSLVYGDPPIARLTDGVFRVLGPVVPSRDIGAEKTEARRFEDLMDLSVGQSRTMAPDQAAVFLRDRLPKHRGGVRGRVPAERFKVMEAILEPNVEVHQVPSGRWRFDVSFEGERGHAELDAVMRAWEGNRSLVPLMDGGYAPLPVDWLREHGPILRELLEARDARGEVGRQSTASLVELLEGDPASEVPTDLTKLQSFLEGEDGLPDVEPPDGLVAELRPYQRVGFHWLRFLREVGLSGILADDMGLGKTLQALTAILDAGGRSLVIAPTSVLRNWKREAAKFTPELTVNVFHGSDRKLDDSDITLTSYAILRLDLDLLREHHWSYVVLDEAQAIKNARSQTARAACAVRAEHRICLTGTPVENRLEELWSLFRFLMPGFLGSQKSFKDRYSRPIELGDRNAETALRTRVRPYVLRRLKKQVAKELPPLTDMVVRCEMSEEQRRIYETVRLAARNDVQQVLAERGVEKSTMQILEALLRMRQACCDPALLPGGAQDAPACKLDRLEELLVDIIVDDHKALIFSQWTSLLDRVEVRLKALDIPWVRLDGSTRNRQEIIDRFQSPEGPPVFLLSLKAGGTGLNLTAADYVVHLDPWWNPAVQQQATDRAHRIGQDKPVVSCRFIAEDTVEERILELQDAKRALADAALGTESAFLKSLDASDLRALFDAA